jgi:hypothetical protein
MARRLVAPPACKALTSGRRPRWRPALRLEGRPARGRRAPRDQPRRAGWLWSLFVRMRMCCRRMLVREFAVVVGRSCVMLHALLLTH